MEVTFDLIDYKKLAGLKAEEILFEILEDYEYADRLFIKSGYDFGIPDSYTLFGKLQDICEHIKSRKAEIEDTKFQPLEEGLFRMFIPAMMYDDLSFNDFPEEGYISSVSNAHLKLIQQDVIQMDTSFPDDFLADSESEYRSKLEDYLNGCQELISYGAEYDLGLLIHMG